MANIPYELAIAKQHHQAGRLDVAEQIYCNILQVDPDQVDALHLLGILALQLSNLESAAEYLKHALRLRANEPDLHNHLGEALRGLGRFADAIACYQTALQIQPGHALAHNNLGNALKSQGRLVEAIASFQQALRLDPGLALAHNSLGVALSDQGELTQAIACYQQALFLRPNFPEAYNNLGNALKARGQFAEAIACYRCALQLEPNHADVYVNLGNALKDDGQLADAITCYQRALELRPDSAGAYNNLGNVWKDQGLLAEAIASYRQALPFKDSIGAHSSLLFTLNYSPDYDACAILEEHRGWNDRHAKPLAKFIQRHGNDPTPGRRLRIGYVSPNFRDHCQGFFTTPLFSTHDHQHYEIFCYADVIAPDSVTGRLRTYADNWRNIAGLPDVKVADLVRDDRIDILVDLTMHMDRNRLLVFARKPAPVQVSWLAYPGTTGLTTMDYRLTDPYLEPPNLEGPIYTEESMCLPETFWCYDPLTSEPPINPLPALTNGFLTFGCFNNFCKVTDQTLALWARVLKTTDRSRLMLLAPVSDQRGHVLSLLEKEGVAPARITFVSRQPRPRYLKLYHKIDMALDTLPSNGHTTSLDSLWMGVPVATLAGQTVGGRAGVSQLSNLGLRDLIAHTPEEMVRVVLGLAGDLPALSKLRATLRERMQASPLMDAPRFARHMEAAYREMWQRWCAGTCPGRALRSECALPEATNLAKQ